MTVLTLPPSSKKARVVPIPPLLSGDLLLERHIESTTRTIEKIFAPELSCGDFRREKLPLLRWNDCQKAPGGLLLFLLCEAEQASELDLFFHELVSHSLLSGEPLDILSSRSLTFSLNDEKGRSYYFAELLVKVENEKQLTAISAHLPSLAAELTLGSLSKSYSKHLIEMKRLSPGEKNAFIYERVVTLMRRYPKKFENSVFHDVQRFLVHMRGEFCHIRDKKHLTRLICSNYLAHRALEKDRKVYPHKRHLYFRFLKTDLRYPFGLKRVLGIAISLNMLKEYECFEERHILKAIQRIIPDAKAIPDSFYSMRDDETQTLTVYLEIDKHPDLDFSKQDLIELKKRVGLELKNSIESLSPSLFIPHNEEELYRNIIALSQELKYVHDLPQAIISFQEQANDVLKFNVVLLRLLHKKSRPLLETNQPEIPIIPERVVNVGLLRKKYVKEANCFSLEVNADLFLRKNHSVDLVRARQYVVKAIEKMVGPFRDYNGGFLLKQNQQLEAVKKVLGDEGKEQEFQIEELFYSLTPTIVQTILSPEAGKLLCSLFLTSLTQEISKNEGFVCLQTSGKEGLAIVVKAVKSEIKEKLILAIKELDIDPITLGMSLIEIDGLYYICFLYLNPEEELSVKLLSIINRTLQKWEQTQLDLQIVRLYLPHAAQSLDPRIASDRTSGVVIKMLYDGLMKIGKQGSIEYAIAHHVTISPDKKRYTFHLKETSWSNGTPVTAFDFEYAWKKTLEPSFRSIYSFLLFSIKNAKSAKRGEVPIDDIGIHAIDARTLVVELEYPTPYFLSLTAHWTYSPLCREIDQRHPGWAYHNAESHVSNGPFKLSLWKLNDDLELVKNPLYHDAPSVKLDKIRINIIEEDPVALQMFEKGELDWYGDPINKMPVAALSKLQEDSKVTVGASHGLFLLQLNIKRFPFTSAKIRKAFALALSRETIAKDVLKYDDEPALCFYRNPENPHLAKFKDGDTETARLLFEEGLQELGLTRESIPPILFTHSDIDEHEVISREVSRQWEEVLGVKVKFERYLWQNFFQLISQQEYVVCGMTWYSRYEDPMYYLDLLTYREEAIRLTDWRNPLFLKYLAEGKEAIEPEKRMDAFCRAEKIALDEMPVIPLFFQKLRYIKNPRLKGVILSDIGQIDFREAYLETQNPS